MDKTTRTKSNRREFFKKTGVVTLAAAAAALTGAGPAEAGKAEQEKAIKEYWEQMQLEHEASENALKAEWKTFDSPPKYTYRGTDSMDRTPTFYAPLMEECKYLPEFQSLFTTGTAGRYFDYTLGFGMKDIIRFHGHSCEALYYTAAICRLIIDKMFPNQVVDRTLLRGVVGISPCISDSMIYITGGRLQFGTHRIEPSLGHAVVLQRIDTNETWMGCWKDGVQSWNAIKVFGTPNKANPLPHKKWSAWKYEPVTPAEQLDQCKITWKYEKPELLQRLRDIKDNLKYLPKGQKPTMKKNEVREEFCWLQYRHLRQVFSHPLQDSFQIKRVPDYKWEYPHVEPMWIPRLDQKAKWAPYLPHPAKMDK